MKEGSERPKVHTIDEFTDGTYFKNTADRTVQIIRKYLNSGSKPEDMMVLSRIDKGGYLTDVVRNKLEEEDIPVTRGGRDGVDVMSAHNSKGKEAKHVILLNASQGHSGFSPEAKESELTNLPRDLKLDTEAEERRVFYVAITRAEDTLDILTKPGEESQFLREIVEYLEHVRSIASPGREGEEVDLIATVDQLWQNDHRKISQSGVLRDSTGTGNFVAWKNTSPPQVEPDETYIFRGLKVSEGQEEKELHFTQYTEIEKIDSINH